MDIISTWAANRGLSISEEFVKEQLGFPNFQSIITEKIDLINNKLDTLIEAPYRQALMYLKEDEKEKCKEKLVEAISNNELNLPALFLYALLLLESGKITLAIGYFEETIKKFGSHKNLFSEEFLKIFDEALKTLSPFGNVKEISIQYSTERIKAFAFTPTYLCFRQLYVHRNWGSSYYSSYTDMSGIEVYDWNGKHITSISIPDSEIYSITDNYIILNVRERSFAARKLKIFRLNDGKELFPSFHISKENVDSLFYRDNYTYINSVDYSNGFNYGNARISMSNSHVKISKK